jgi:predicted nucleotidyltransferase
MDELLRSNRDPILAVLARFGARNPRVFGSMAMGPATAASDVDLLVDMEPGRTLLDLIGLEQELAQILGHAVDVVTEGGVSPFLRDRLLAEAVPL